MIPQERLRCRASYGVAERGENLTLNLRCASDSYNFDLAGDVAYRGGAISGSWRMRFDYVRPKELRGEKVSS
jgi:hypothetical protein